MKNFNLILLVLVTVFSSCTAQNATEGGNISPEAFKKKMSESNIILLDVRTAGEVAQGKIPSSINIDYNGSQYESKTSALDKSKTILVYCAVGGRSGRTMDHLTKQGYTVYNLSGGINAWNSKGFEIIK